MSKHSIIAIVIAAVVILGAGAAFLYSQSRTNPTDNENSSTVAKKVDTSKTGGVSLASIKDVFVNGGNSQCTFSAENKDGITSGSVYVSGDNARGEFETTVSGETFSTNMIRKDDTFLMWGDSFPTGLKLVMSVDEWAESIDERQSDSDGSTFNPNAEVDFNCSTWTVDNSFFNEPTDIEFTSIEGSIGPDTASFSIPEELESTDQCEICNALSGEARNVCLQQFSCE